MEGKVQTVILQVAPSRVARNLREVYSPPSSSRINESSSARRAAFSWKTCALPTTAIRTAGTVGLRLSKDLPAYEYITVSTRITFNLVTNLCLINLSLKTWY